MSEQVESHTFRLRWTTTVDIYTTVTIPASDMEGWDDDFPEAEAEERAHDKAMRLITDRLDQVAVPMGDVSIHGAIEGMEAAEVEHVTRPGSAVTS